MQRVGFAAHTAFSRALAPTCALSLAILLVLGCRESDVKPEPEPSASRGPGAAVAPRASGSASPTAPASASQAAPAAAALEVRVPGHEDLARRCKPRDEPQIDRFYAFLAEWNRCLDGLRKTELARALAAAGKEQRAALEEQDRQWHRLAGALCYLVEEHQWLDWDTLTRPVGGVPNLHRGRCEIAVLEQRVHYLRSVRANDARGYAEYVRAAAPRGRAVKGAVLEVQRRADGALANGASRDAGSSASGPPDLAAIRARARDVGAAAGELARNVEAAFPRLAGEVTSSGGAVGDLEAHFLAPASF